MADRGLVARVAVAAGGIAAGAVVALVALQNAGGDAECSIDQRQNFGDVHVEGDAGGNGSEEGDGGGDGGGDSDEESDSSSEDVGGGDVQTVELAETGFDAWVLALLGGLALISGLALLALQRRGRSTF